MFYFLGLTHSTLTHLKLWRIKDSIRSRTFSYSWTHWPRANSLKEWRINTRVSVAFVSKARLNMVGDNEDRAGEDCSCGRSNLKVHCPNCGSYVVVGYAKRETVNRGGWVIERIRAYRCRRCSEVFNDDKWRNECHAPSPQLGRPRRATID